MKRKYIIFLLIYMPFFNCTVANATQIINIFNDTTQDFIQFGNDLLRYQTEFGEYLNPSEFNNYDIQSSTFSEYFAPINGDRFQSELEFHYDSFYNQYIITIIVIAIQVLIVLAIITIPFYRAKIKNLISTYLTLFFILFFFHFSFQGYHSSSHLFNIRIQKQVYSFRLKTVFWKQNPTELYTYISQVNRDEYGEYLYSVTVDGDAFIASVGTDGVFQYSKDQINTMRTDDLIGNLVTYSPTNGLQSNGDLWMLFILPQNTENNKFEVVSGL